MAKQNSLTPSVIFDLFFALLFGIFAVLMLVSAVHIYFGKTYTGTITSATQGFGLNNYGVSLNGTDRTVQVSEPCKNNCPSPDPVGTVVKVRVGSDGSTDFTTIGAGVSSTVAGLVSALFAYGLVLMARTNAERLPAKPVAKRA